LIANAISAPVGLVTAVVFIHFWGLNGAAISLVGATACYGMVFCWAFLRDIGRASTTMISACAGMGRVDG